jgi:hypothetical protein
MEIVWILFSDVQSTQTIVPIIFAPVEHVSLLLVTVLGQVVVLNKIKDVGIVLVKMNRENVQFFQVFFASISFFSSS